MNSFKKTPLFLAIATATVSLSQPVFSQGVKEIEEVVTIGTRVKGRTAEDLPVAVDVLNADALKNTGQTEVGRMLQALAPSFNFSSSSISDGSDALRPATLRGLGPDQTLVLINGKRRHQASLIHINTSVGRGTAGVDMNAIPSAAIKRIEVLRDGAAAQYGSDAIAGVINIVLKDADEGGSISSSYGGLEAGDGETINIDLNGGFALGEAGFVNATLNYRDRGSSNRAGKLGICGYGTCTDSDNNGFDEIVDPRELTLDRDAFRIGDAKSEQLALIINAALNVGMGELYSFITYSERENQSGAFFRHPSKSPVLDDGDFLSQEGFLPKINSQIDDYSVNFGYRSDLGEASTLDISYTQGKNSIDYWTSNSMNFDVAKDLRDAGELTSDEIRAGILRQADAYGLELGLSTFNLDFTHVINDLAIAAGYEYRVDKYQINSGDLYSYDRGGIQGFGGIEPSSEVSEDRNVWSVFVDAEYHFTHDLLVSAALRYDDYIGFGDTTNAKLAANWAVNDILRFRSAVSTGFRAPSMQQLYFNNVSTQFDSEGNAQQVGTFRNDSLLAQAIGIPTLKEEESTNYSFGIVLTPTDQLSITLDYYAIDIDDRIVISNQLEGDDAPGNELSDALASVHANSAQFFLNGADTETRGFDLVATYQDIEFARGTLDITLAGNKTKTDVTDLFTSKAGALGTIDSDVVFSSQQVSIIEEWQPETRVSLSGLYHRNNWTVNLAFNRYGKYTVEDGGRQTFDAKIITDLSVEYAFDSGLTLSAGGNNIFDVYPDKNRIGNSRTGALEDGVGGDVIVDSPGVFTYSRRSAPFGFNGAYWYGKVAYNF